jgi:predicted Zn-dependent protease
MELMEKRKKVAEREAGAAILLGPTTGNVLAIALLGQLHSLSYSRDAEARADLTGADVCAAAGYNPWGLVWLFKDFDNADTRQIPQFLSDHPSNKNRVAALEQHFRENPSVFGKFNPDRGSAVAFAAAKSAPVVFLR